MNNNYYLSPVYGKVVDNQDPDSLGRVKVLVDQFGAEAETGWLPVMNFFGGSEFGAFFLPEIDDQVIVCFIGESPEQGVVLGSVWSDTQKPPSTEENSGSDLNKDGENNVRFIKSRSGHMIILDDKDGEEKIQIIASGGNTRFEFSASDELLNIETDKDITITAGGKLTIDADETKITSQKDISISGSGVTVESGSSDVTVKSATNVAIEGTTVKLN